MIRYITLWVLLMMIAGCGTGDSPTTIIPSGQVTLTMPQTGMVYYSEVLTVRGMAQDIPPDGFQVTVTDSDGITLAQARVLTQAGAWQVNLPITMPTEVTAVTIRVQDNARTQTYVTGNATVAPLAMRPSGQYATLFAPSDQETVGGEQILVRGSASGVAELQVELLGADEAVVSELTVVLDTPNVLDELPFIIDLPTNGYVGFATIVLLNGDTQLDSINVTLERGAG